MSSAAFQIRPSDIGPDGRLMLPAQWGARMRPGQIMVTDDGSGQARWLVTTDGTAIPLGRS